MRTTKKKKIVHREPASERGFFDGLSIFKKKTSIFLTVTPTFISYTYDKAEFPDSHENLSIALLEVLLIDLIVLYERV